MIFELYIDIYHIDILIDILKIYISMIYNINIFNQI